MGEVCIRRFFMVVTLLTACFMVFAPLMPVVKAIPLSPDEIKAGNQYPNWVADNCSTTVSATTGTTNNGKVYVLGDSVLVGAYYDTGDLNNDLSSAGWSASADASGGRGMSYPGTDPRGNLPGKTKSGLDAIKTDSDAIKSSDTVVIELGTNETDPPAGASKSSALFKSEMEQAISEVKNINSSATIYWVNLFSKATQPYTPWVSQYNQVIGSVASDKNINVIDTTNAGISLSPDGIHPDTAGYKTLSTTITSAIGQGGSASPSNPAGGGAGGGGSGVVWPFATKDHTQFNRIDQGWDIQDKAGAGVYAIAPGTIDTYQPDPGGFGNDYPVEHLDNSIGGPSDWVYYGHVHIIPGLKGKHVDAGQLIAHANTTDGENGSAAPPGWLEIGFAQPNTDAPVQIGGETVATQAGQKMHDILINAQPSAGGGAVTDPGNLVGNCCPSGGGGGGIGTLTGNTPEEQVWNFFKAAGLSDNDVAAVMGNLDQESGFNPEAIENGGTTKDPTSVGHTGWGLAQWYGDEVLGEARDNHISGPIYELLTQLNLILAQMHGSAPTGTHDTFSGIQHQSSLSDKVNYFEQYYEGAGISGPRLADAIIILGQYGGMGGGAAPGGAAGGAGGCFGPASTPSGYQNPLRDWNNLIDNRVDQGVDYSGVGPVYAIGNGTIDYASSSTSWPGGNYISYKLSDGPAAGKEVYVAEDCKVESGISRGKPVTSGTVLCKTTTTGGYIYIETGWSAPTIDNAIDTTLQPGCYDIGNSKSTAFGMNFRDLMVSLGVKSGNEVDKPIVCSLPSGWPTWQ